MSEFKPGDVVQVRFRRGKPERYILTSPSTGACEWHTAYSLDTGTVGMVQLLRSGDTTVRKLKKDDALLTEVRTAMANHMSQFCERWNYVAGLL